ncbi:heterokaryon incompatibility protein-domain-containing protein [Lasiosphaeris hirsuta]|uniref:Heterokaryon incompatibility protein-domain-containing protein n=1 Tax=Lasiosphaeris hirsuta TaxID=260670 RepID=A0AA40AYX0_9PEZI|nr:heterokaryon incompatibility protein-domain-containing protein [Lasiosphaeris hirsuta]
MLDLPTTPKIVPEDWDSWALLDGWTLCRHCRPLLGLTKGDWQHFVSSTRRNAKFVTLAHKCVLCSAIYQAFRHFAPAIIEHNPTLSYYYSPFPSEPGGVGCNYINAQLIPPSTVDLVTQAESLFLTIERGLDPATHSLIGDLPPQQEPALSEHNLAFIQRQWADCLSNPAHDCEPRPGLGIEWPQRMIQIAETTAVLVDFDAGMASRYAALSYCWGEKDELGQNPPLRATSPTWSSLRSGIPFFDLPLTIQQAIMVCRCLDIKYVWIDALCILQDDISDWENEAKKMATVYSMAKITIIAAASTSCHSGFSEVDSGLVLNTPLPPPTRLVARRANRTGFHRSAYETESLDPIDRRGWTYQEELLSTRYIRFTASDIQWRCRVEANCLCRQPADCPEPGLSSGQTPVALPSTRWQGIVENFNRRQFTADIDKLPAFSGLARKLATELKVAGIDENSYAAGVWKHYLSTGGDIMWHRDHHLTKVGRSYESYVAPSFSWASIASPITFTNVAGWIDFQMKRLFELVEVEIEPTSSTNPFGRVSEGFLRVRVPVIPCKVRSPLRGSPEVKLLEDTALEVTSWIFDCAVSRVTLKSGNPSVQRSTYALSFEDTPAYVALFVKNSNPSGFLKVRAEGLLLGKLDLNNGYQRLAYVVGRVRADFEESSMKIWERIIDIH